MKNTLLLTRILFIVSVLSGCVAIKSKYNSTLLKKNLNKSSYFNSHFTGFALFDPKTDEYLYEWNANKYFNMASNTKLLTLYAGLRILGDSIPGLIYEEKHDTLYFTGTGDPSFLHPSLDRNRVFDFLQDTSKVLVYVKTSFDDNTKASGWTWEDYQYYYQPERSGFPIYGNVVSFLYDSLADSFYVYPNFFNDYVEILDDPSPAPQRNLNANIFSFAPDTSRSNYKNRVPFITSDEMVIRLLEDTLKQKVNYKKEFEFVKPKTYYSLPTWDVYAYMLKVSDNLTAEQLIYNCATVLDYDLNSDQVRRYVTQQFFRDVKHPPIWRDGSGLSRYNLATPIFMIELMNKIEQEVPLATLKNMMPVGGVDGTIKNYYKALEGEQPYVFAKTGTLSNNHNLTGVIQTESGNDLYFSFMNNNYPTGSYPVKKEMEKILRMIYENF
ncbi:MAG: D-alanyl-D-alanine carboxypeptidase [Reichenbachiella sp.]